MLLLLCDIRWDHAAGSDLFLLLYKCEQRHTHSHQHRLRFAMLLGEVEGAARTSVGARPPLTHVQVVAVCAAGLECRPRLHSPRALRISSQLVRTEVLVLVPTTMYGNVK